jgi:hypothetical protein
MARALCGKSLLGANGRKITAFQKKIHETKGDRTDFPAIHWQRIILGVDSNKRMESALAEVRAIPPIAL